MKRILLVMFLVVLCAPVFALDTGAYVTLEGYWDVYFARIEKGEQYSPVASSAEAFAVFELSGTLSLVGKKLKTYRWQLDTINQEIKVFALQEEILLWIWHYQFLGSQISLKTRIIVCTVWCPDCDPQNEEGLTILVRQPK